MPTAVWPRLFSGSRGGGEGSGAGGGRLGGVRMSRHLPRTHAVREAAHSPPVSHGSPALPAAPHTHSPQKQPAADNTLSRTRRGAGSPVTAPAAVSPRPGAPGAPHRQRPAPPHAPRGFVRREFAAAACTCRSVFAPAAILLDIWLRWGRLRASRDANVGDQQGRVRDPGQKQRGPRTDVVVVPQGCTAGVHVELYTLKEVSLSTRTSTDHMHALLHYTRMHQHVLESLERLGASG